MIRLVREAREFKALALVGALLGTLLTGALAQDLPEGEPGIGVTVEFPAVGSLQISANEVAFDLTGPDYPPTEFPAYYLPASPTQPIIITITSNTTDWQVLVEFTGFLNEDANLQLPADQLEFRLDSVSEWLPLNQLPITLALSVPSTDPLAAPSEHTLELRLKVTGDEAPGVYAGTLIFTLSSQ